MILVLHIKILLIFYDIESHIINVIDEEYKYYYILGSSIFDFIKEKNMYN